jgi:catechol 2,3-dioxygenase-like lactoylglutathione lyase family enzyme
MMTFVSAVPVLQVADVARSIAWYRSVLGFIADPFPEAPPHSFAILLRDNAEIMLQCARHDATDLTDAAAPPNSGWAVYLRLTGGRLLALAEAVRAHTPVLRGPERMLYGQVEFEVADPDGYRLCMGEFLAKDVDVPAASE